LIMKRIYIIIKMMYKKFSFNILLIMLFNELIKISEKID